MIIKGLTIKPLIFLCPYYTNPSTQYPIQRALKALEVRHLKPSVRFIEVILKSQRDEPILHLE